MSKVLVTEGCREELGDPTFNKCWKPAEFLLWGKLFPPEALGPRCYKHAEKHIGNRNMDYRLKDWAVLDMRGLYRESK